MPRSLLCEICAQNVIQVTNVEFRKQPSKSLIYSTRKGIKLHNNVKRDAIGEIAGDIIAIPCSFTLHNVMHNWTLYDSILLLK